MKKALLVFYRNAIRGRVKTRLAAGIGEDAALEVYLKLVNLSREAAAGAMADIIVYYSEYIDKNDAWQGLIGRRIQSGGDLGERMKAAFETTFHDGYQVVGIMGTDCPELSAEILNNAFELLVSNDVVIGPATDGGYYFLGMRKLYGFLFDNKQWSTDAVLRETVSDCKKNNLSVRLLPILSDIDTAQDLPRHWKPHV